MNLSKKATTIIIAILALITVAALGVTMWALFLREPDEGGKIILNPDYAPQQREAPSPQLEKAHMQHKQPVCHNEGPAQSKINA